MNVTGYSVLFLCVTYGDVYVQQNTALIAVAVSLNIKSLSLCCQENPAQSSRTFITYYTSVKGYHFQKPIS